MKKICLFVLLCVANWSYSQNQELTFDYRFGLTTHQLHPTQLGPYTKYAYQKMYGRYDQGVIIGYHYRIWKRFNLFLSGGLEFSGADYNFPLIDYHNTQHQLANISIHENRYTLRYGVHKHFSFYDSKVLLDLGVEVVDKYYFSKNHEYSQGFQSNSQDDWIKYSYDIKTYYGGYKANDEALRLKNYFFLNLDYMAKLKLQLHKNVYLNLGFTYSRNNIFYYNYSYTLLYFQNGSSTPTGTYQYNELQGNFHPKYIIRDHFLYFNAGVTYKFDKLLNLKKRKS